MKDETTHYDKKVYLQSPIKKNDRISDMTIDSECSRCSEVSISPKILQNYQIIQNNCQYKKLFQQKTKQQQISSTLHKKAINWLISFCWTRNYSQDILWFAIGYYYAYIFSNPLKKQRLTLLLITAINLSLKVNSPHQVLSFSIMKSLLNNKYQTKQFRQIQSEVVLLLKFDLYFPIMFGKVYRLGLDQEQIAKMKFIYELMFFKNYDVALNQLLLDDMIILVKEPEKENYIKQEIVKLGLNSKNVQIIIQKFESKFHVQKFLEKLKIEFC